jgi:hypothetical protein
VDKETGAIIPLESGVLAEKDSGRELAAEVAKAMDLITERLELETPHPSTARRVRGARTVPRDFVLSMISVSERRPDLPYLGQFDGAEAREALEAADAYRMLADRTAMFLASLNYTVEARWAKVVAEAMKRFSLASLVAEDSKNAELAAEVENLRARLGRKGQRKKKSAGETGGP